MAPQHIQETNVHFKAMLVVKMQDVVFSAHMLTMHDWSYGLLWSEDYDSDFNLRLLAI